MSKRRCLLITGTIVPNSNFVTETNPTHRKEEYLNALHFYRQQFTEPIFFLENSEFDIEQEVNFFNALKELDVQIMKFPPSKEFSKGKGYQEFFMLDEAVENIKNDFDSFIKITGRQIITNIKQLANQKSEGIVIDRYKSLKVALTNLFYCTTHFYTQHIKNAYREVNDEELYYIEKVLYQKLKGNKKVNLFYHSPKLVGVSGSTGINLQGNPTKFKIRNFERKVLNGIGIKSFPYKY